MRSAIENVTRVWHGICRVWHGTCAIVWHGGLCHTLSGVWHGPCAILWHGGLCHTMARWQARVQNHTLKKKSLPVKYSDVYDHGSSLLDKPVSGKL